MQHVAADTVLWLSLGPAPLVVRDQAVLSASRCRRSWRVWVLETACARNGYKKTTKASSYARLNPWLQKC
jgi:hypothetical protein